MKEYFKQIFEHEHWANQKVLESMLCTSETPQQAIVVYSHIIAAQRIWLDRINGNKTDVKLWEIFDTKIMLELLEINYADIKKVIDTQDFEQLISYQNTDCQYHTTIIKHILSHLALHASYHRGQVVLMLKDYMDILPTTDFILYAK